MRKKKAAAKVAATGAATLFGGPLLGLAAAGGFVAHAAYKHHKKNTDGQTYDERQAATEDDGLPPIANVQQPVSTNQQKRRPYHELNPARREIRLLRFSAESMGWNNLLIRASLEPASLAVSRPRQYTALSYVWGSRSNMKSIDLEGEPWRVTSNLHEFVHTLFSSPVHEELRNDRFWVDEICIDQEDKRERAIQVGMMRDIYHNAAKTVLWLGPADSRDDLAFQWLEHLSGYHDEFYNISVAERNGLWIDEAWTALTFLLERPYFRRRWIIQETVISPNVFVLCGSNFLTWDKFYKGVFVACIPLFNEMMNQSTVIRRTDIQTVSSIVKYRTRRIEHNGSPSPSLWELLTVLRRQDSSKPHDRVFSLLGLCGKEEASLYTIDYSSLESVFMQAVINNIRIHKNLNTLSACCQAARIERRDTQYDHKGITIFPDLEGLPKSKYLPNLPSWTPNWSSYHAWWILGTLSHLPDDDYSPMFDACGASKAEVENLDTAMHDLVLRVTGVEVDRVAYIHPGSPPRHPEQHEPIDDIYASLWTAFNSFATQNSPYPTSNGRLMAFLRTLTVGGIASGSRQFATDRYVRYSCATLFSRTYGALSVHNGPFEARDYEKPSPAESWEDYALVKKIYPAIEHPDLRLDTLVHFRFFITQQGRLGICRPGTEIGDRVCVIHGASSPIILQYDPARPRGWTVMGEAYVHGIMFGEAVRWGKRTVFDLV